MSGQQIPKTHFQFSAHFSKMEPRLLRERRSFSMLSKVGIPRGISRRWRSDAMMLSASPTGPAGSGISLGTLAFQIAWPFLSRLTSHAIHERPVGGVHLVDEDEPQGEQRRHEERFLFLNSAEDKNFIFPRTW